MSFTSLAEFLQLLFNNILWAGGKWLLALQAEISIQYLRIYLHYHGIIKNIRNECNLFLREMNDLCLSVPETSDLGFAVFYVILLLLFGL
jgi:hypothetical protein